MSIASVVSANLNSAVPALLSFAKGGAGTGARVDATADADAKTAITDRPELFRDLLRILRDAASPVAIRCMAAAVQVHGRPARVDGAGQGHPRCCLWGY